MVGNKLDLKDKREVSEDSAKVFAKEMGISYIEMSAKSDSDVDMLRETIANLVMDFL